jgi:hypothetical protein
MPKNRLQVIGALWYGTKRQQTDTRLADDKKVRLLPIYVSYRLRTHCAGAVSCDLHRRGARIPAFP